MNKKIIFLTGTRADFGKLGSLIDIVEKSHTLESHIFVTGMHTLKKYGYTYDEIKKKVTKMLEFLTIKLVQTSKILS